MSLHPNLPAADNYGTAWRLVHYEGSGNFLVAAGGHKICRYDADYIYFWDNRNKQEIGIERQSFDALLNLAPKMVATPLEQRR